MRTITRDVVEHAKFGKGGIIGWRKEEHGKEVLVQFFNRHTELHDGDSMGFYDENGNITKGEDGFCHGCSMSDLKFIRKEEFKVDVKCEELINQIPTKVVIENDNEIYFYLENGKIYRFYHIQECCEEVWVEDISGNLQDIVGEKIINFEKRTNKLKDTPTTYTYYDIDTFNYHIQIRWCGESNGYYSEEVDLEEVLDE